MNNISKEDYLSTIFKHRDSDGAIKSTQIAERLDISGAAVTDMLKKLSKDGYVDYKKYKGIRLTKVGEQYAMNMVRRHRIWEVFLHQVVGVPWDMVHAEAENLEHSSSDDLIDRLEEMLDFPEFDPHGDPIPDKNGNPEQKKAKSLSVIRPGSKVKVLKVNDFDSSFLKHISRIGIELNKEIEVKDVLNFDGSMLLAIDGKELNVSNKLAANIFVINSN
jgi:DtxR family Mn-dependent transcriptional regulator